MSSAWSYVAKVLVAGGLLSGVLQPCVAKEDSKPIVDIRFDAPYRQVESSFGDEWAPTWGRDDVLYTGNDDGTSFGGVPNNPLAFGKLEGSDPYHLHGTTINGMQSFSEGQPAAPERAGWVGIDVYQLDGTLYRFAPCAAAGVSDSTCLMMSLDSGVSWTPSNGGKPLFPGTRFSAPGFIALSADHAASSNKTGEFVFAASYIGVFGGAATYVLGRVPRAQLAAGRASDWSFERASDLSWQSDPNQALWQTNSRAIGPDEGNWKTMNSYSVDGVLYMFVTRCRYPEGSDDPQHRHIFQNASIIKSTDGGRSWTRPAYENYVHPMFPGKRFGAPYFVWYGKDGAASADNAGKYVYAISNNGHFENADDYVLGRVLRSKLPDLSAADWSFYTAGDGMQDGSWTSSLAGAKPVLVAPRRSSMTGMTYIPALRRYVMVVWHYHSANFSQAIQDKDLGTVLEFYEAPRPWGHWTRVKSVDTGRLGWYAPLIGQRFQTKSGPSSVQVFLYGTGFTAAPGTDLGLDATLYKLNYMPITLSTKPLQHRNPGFAGGQ